MYHALYAVTGDEELLTPEFKQDHNFARWTLAAIERGYVPETVYSDSTAWREGEGTDALRPMPKENWFQAVWCYPEETDGQQWAKLALSVPSRRRQRSQHMVALLVMRAGDGWRFLVSDSTAPGEGPQWFFSEEEFFASHYATAFEVIVMRPTAQALVPWLVPEADMPPLIEVPA